MKTERRCAALHGLFAEDVPGFECLAQLQFDSSIGVGADDQPRKRNSRHVW